MKKILFLLLITLFPLNTEAKEVKVTFSGCTDGDTAKFIMNDEEIRVRFLAIDTPETVHPNKGVEAYGKDASEYTCNKITNAKKIVLEFDDNSEEIDRYNRYLAWIFVDDSLLQLELIEAGYGKVAYLYGKYKYTNLLESAQEVSQAKKIGIWSDYIESDQVEETSNEEEKTTDDKTQIIVIIGIIIILIVGTISQSGRKKIGKEITKVGKKEFKNAIKKLTK